jgi:tetratricopeptide (TPR) repeat protein
VSGQVRWAVVAVVVPLAFGTGCRHRRVPTAPRAEPLAIEVGGCAAVVGDDLCEHGDHEGPLRLWVPASSAEAITVTIDGARATPTALDPVDLGVRVTLSVPGGAARVDVASAGREAKVRLAPPPHAPAVEGAQALRDRSEFDASTQAVEAAWPSLGERERARAAGIRARNALAEGDVERAEPLFRDAIDRDRRAGVWSDAIQDGCALVYALTMRHRFAGARAVLASLADLAPHDAEGRAAIPYYRSLVAGETGDLRAALADAAQSEALSRRLGLDAQARDARSLVALRLADEGRTREALDRLDALRGTPSAPLPSCDEGTLLVDIGWVELALSDRSDAARADLARAARIFETTCASTRRRVYALTDLALGDLHLGLLDDAKTALASARSAGPRLDAEVELEALEVDAQLLLAHGDAARARAAFERERAAAAGVLSPESEWRALVGAGDAASRAGKARDAARAYEAAERILDTGVVRVPMNDDRARFLGAHDASARRLVSVLVSLGEVAEAARGARRARARAIATLGLRDRIGELGVAERAAWEAAVGAYRAAHEQLESDAEGDWQRSDATLARVRQDRRAAEEKLRADFDRALGTIEPAAPARGADAASWSASEEGTLVLTYFPGETSWFAFATDRESTSGARISEAVVASLAGHGGLLSPAGAEAASAALLAPFAPAIRAARTIRVLPYGELASIDVHALPFDGAPLLARAEVVYPVDLAAREASDPPPATALVVLDPLENLPHAREDGARVTSALGALGPVEVLRGPDAQLAAFARAVPKAGALHFAGHAVYAEGDGVDSALLFAGGARWTAGDTLALPHAPRWVFLSGCETARVSAEETPATVGLAQSFVLAGSETVVAATRVVDDALASEMTAKTYAPGDAGAFSLRAGLRAAQLAIAGQGRGDWAAFRVVVR